MNAKQVLKLTVLGELERRHVALGRAGPVDAGRASTDRSRGVRAQPVRGHRNGLGEIEGPQPLQRLVTRQQRVALVGRTTKHRDQGSACPPAIMGRFDTAASEPWSLNAVGAGSSPLSITPMDKGGLPIFAEVVLGGEVGVGEDLSVLKAHVGHRRSLGGGKG